MAFRTWTSLRDLVSRLPKTYYRRCWMPLDESSHCWIFSTYTKQARLRHLGDVTTILSKRGRNNGPEQSKILVTNLTVVTACRVVDVYRRRWSVERLIKEGARCLGGHQVTKPSSTLNAG